LLLRGTKWNKLAPVAIKSGSTLKEARPMIRKLSSGEYRLYSRKVNPKTGKRRNLGTFKSRAAAEKHEREVQYFKRH
jgi:hypothetical protein